ncbi:MAG: hypothetical protein GVY24_01280 [Planctomycetes bacterium]|nr:hypothetical protein [Planctomycetota bacterium]
MNQANPENPSPPRRNVPKLATSKIALIVGAMVLALLIVSATIDWMPEALGFAPQVDPLFFFIYWVSVFFTLLIAGTLVFFLLYYRQADKADQAPGKATHSTALELTWTIIPVFIVLAIFAYGFKGYMNMAVAPTGSYEIVVIARQWGWQFQYPNGYLDDNLHIPANRDVRLILQSNDVIHSLFIPQLRAKKDVVPGRYNTMWFNAEWKEPVYQQALAEAKAKDERDLAQYAEDKQLFEELTTAIDQAESPEQRAEAQADLDAFPHQEDGEFAWSRPERAFRATDFEAPVMILDLYCTEYCGQSHSQMNRDVFVHRTMADFEAWLEEASFIPGRFEPIEHGRNIWSSQCATCHSIDGSSGTGPTWQNIWGREAELVGGGTWKDRYDTFEEYIAISIRYPQRDIVAAYKSNNMSAFLTLKPLDIYAINQFMKSISDGFDAEASWGQYGEKEGGADGESATDGASSEPAEESETDETDAAEEPVALSQE